MTGGVEDAGRCLRSDDEEEDEKDADGGGCWVVGDIPCHRICCFYFF